MTAIEDVYVARAESTPDEDWIDHGSRMGWALLIKDKRIRWRPAYEYAQVPIFALSDGNLTNRAMVDRFERSRRRIWAQAGNRRREFWVVYEDSIVRRDPP